MEDEKSQERIELEIGAVLPVQKDFDGILSYHSAEILAIKKNDCLDMESSMYYVHYVGYNKRLDEWVGYSRLDTSNVKLPLKNNKKRSKKTSTSKKEIIQESPECSSHVHSGISEDVKVQKEIDLGGNDTHVVDSALESYRKEMETLRTGGSMTMRPEELSRVKNISMIEIGKYRVNTWYFSPYPKSLCNSTMLFICESCLEACCEYSCLYRHRQKCKVLCPPGDEIYRKDAISLFEVDGNQQKIWCRNLCLLSKLFLDHKTLYYDVNPFLFYVLVSKSDHGFHLIGYFSKEKESGDNYNLACIMTLPQHQRKGYGKLLIGLSYELSKIQGVSGSPEKPLSDLGLLGYRSYWYEELFRILINTDGEISIKDLSTLTSITYEDILHTLHVFDLLKYHKGRYTIVLTNKAIDEYRESVKKSKLTLDPNALRWKPRYNHRTKHV